MWAVEKIKELYESSERKVVERKNSRGNDEWNSEMIRKDVNKVMEVIGVERIKMSVVLEILKKSDVRYEKLGYSRMRVSLLYEKKFRFEKGEDGMVEVVKVGV